jgi:hypothetical protein
VVTEGDKAATLLQGEDGCRGEEGREGGEECFWVWNRLPSYQGGVASCGVLIKIQQTLEKKRGERERATEREKYFHPPNRETHS